jgi:phosphate transport system substrate-binding protein
MHLQHRSLAISTTQKNIGRIVGASQSQGVATLAAKTPYSITYAEKQWGTSFGLRAAYIR